MKPNRGLDVKDETAVIKRLGTEAGLSQEDSQLYLKLLRLGQIPASEAVSASNLLERGMAIVSGDGKRVIPVHPRLAIANFYRTWRENMVREINERRMRVDKLIIELIPVYEAAMEKKTMGGAG